MTTLLTLYEVCRRALTNNRITMKRILINATQSEELRVAIVDIATQSLLDLLVERQSHKTKTGNIYMGEITAIEPSLDACFVNFGSGRHGFLPFKEIVPNYFLSNPSQSGRSAAIKDTLRVGQKLMVQVEREERGSKGAALTTFISLAGSYLVLMPNNPRAGGISRRVEGGDRDELREILSNLPIPEEMGLIVRTAGVGKAITELQWDLNTLLKQWEAIQKAAIDRSPPFLIHQESDVLIRAIRDYLREDVSEIWVDDLEVFERLKNHLEQIRPDFLRCLKLYTSAIPLFNRYQIEHQIEAAHEREVRLPSGGSIVIGHTEALVAIDVNSGQATKGKDIEQTAFEINKEAARVIACQLRLRDIGGLIVIDFIDMPSTRHRREVENELRTALKLDKARTQVGTISPRFGLLELSRQRLRHSLGEATRLVCPRCDGWGSVRSVESLSLSILRMMEEDAIRQGTVQIQAQLPVEVATFIINEKRDLIATIEKSQNVQIFIIPDPKLDSPHYRIKRVTESEIGTSGKSNPSYRLLEIEEPDTPYKKWGAQAKIVDEKPAVKSLFAETTPTAHRAKKLTTNLVKRLITSLFGASTEEHVKSKKSISPTPSATVRAVPEKNKRTQERTSPKSSVSSQRRPQSGTPVPSEKVKKPTPPAAHTPVSLSSATTAPAPHPSRRGGRGGHQQRRASANTPPAQTSQSVNATALVPPTYLQSSISDADLETYYQESMAFTHKAPSKKVAPTTAPTPDESQGVTEASVQVSKEPNTSTELKVVEKAGTQVISQPNVEKPDNNSSRKQAMGRRKPSEKQVPKTSSAVIPPTTLSTGEGPQEKLWVPHKVASAPTSPPVVTPQQTVVSVPAESSAPAQVEVDQKKSEKEG